MRCISLWQPWATAIALGYKRIETRSWAHSYKGEIAIHAAKNVTALLDGTPRDLCEELEELTSGERHFPVGMAAFPLGAVVAVAGVVDYVPTSLVDETDAPCWRGLLTDVEFLFGNYEPRRFGWIFENVCALRLPIPLRGQQGMWTLTPSEEKAVRYAAVEAARKECGR